jgi:hypothetical protein
VAADMISSLGSPRVSVLEQQTYGTSANQAVQA